MALPSLATVDDLEVWLGVTFAGSESARAGAVLDAASALIRNVARQTWEDEDVPDVVASIAVQVAARIWPNPTMVTDDTAGPFVTTFGSPYLLPQERTVIEGFRPSASGLWAQPVTRGPLEMASSAGADNIFIDTIPAGDPIMWAGPDGY